jgi:NADH-ubiquinone oxidoreductase chain 1
MFIYFPLLFVIFIRVLAELNRTPIDFVEGESELVSGFNIEYFRGRFALIFMAEYGILLFFSYLILVMFTRLALRNFVYIYVFMNLIVIFIIFLRGLLPRIRYDELIYLCWKLILPFILNYLVYTFGVKFTLMILL